MTPTRYRHPTTLAIATLRPHGRGGVLVGHTDGRAAQSYASGDAARRALVAAGYEPEAPARPMPLRVATDLAIEQAPEAYAVVPPDARELRALREQADASQETLASLLGVSLRTYQRMEYGSAPIRAGALLFVRAAAATGGLAKREQAPPPRAKGGR